MLQGWHVPRSGGSAADIFALGLILLEATGFVVTHGCRTNLCISASVVE